MMDNRKAVKWKGNILDVFDEHSGQFQVRLDGEPDVAVFDHGMGNWPSSPAWVERIAPGDERMELEEYLLMNFFED